MSRHPLKLSDLVYCWTFTRITFRNVCCATVI